MGNGRQGILQPVGTPAEHVCVTRDSADRHPEKSWSRARGCGEGEGWRGQNAVTPAGNPEHPPPWLSHATPVRPRRGSLMDGPPATLSDSQIPRPGEPPGHPTHSTGRITNRNRQGCIPWADSVGFRPVKCLSRPDQSNILAQLNRLCRIP